MKFVNRINELKELNRIITNGAFVVVFGRRRVGKSELIRKWAKTKKVVVSQAIEASTELQLSQIIEDFKEIFPHGILPRNWKEFFAAMNLINDPITVVFDEFPYPVESDPTLPSRFQRWVDIEKPKHMNLILLGSSQCMTRSIFLDASAPLYGRAWSAPGPPGA